MSLIACQVQLLGEAGAVPSRILLLNDGNLDWAGEPALALDKESAQLIIKAFDEQGVELVVDYHHSTVEQEQHHVEKAHAAGWIKALEYVEGEGLYAAVEWTPVAEREIRSRQYKYVSPVITTDKATNRIERLHSVALTNRPRTRNQQELLDAAEDTETKRMPKECGTMKGVRRLVCQALAAEDDAGQEPEMTQDAEAIGKLLAALRDQGVDIGDDASLAEIIEAAIAALGGGEAEETEAEKEAREAEEAAAAMAAAEAKAKADAEGGQSDEVKAELCELRIKAASVGGLNKRVEKLEADKTRDRVGALIDEQIDAGKILPDDKKVLADARWLAEHQEARFKRFYAAAQPIAEPGVLTKGGGRKPKSDRDKVIAGALAELEETPEKGQGAPKEFYIASALIEHNMVPLSEDEVKALVA